MTDIELRYMKAIRAKVCRTCSDLLPDQACGLADRVCPIERNLLEIVQIAHFARGESRSPYVHELRSTVCAACENSDAKGNCPVRDAGKCPLDRYFSVVFEAIEDVQEELGQMMIN
jgi:hypothetical protein